MIPPPAPPEPIVTVAAIGEPGEVLSIGVDPFLYAPAPPPAPEYSVASPPPPPPPPPITTYSRVSLNDVGMVNVPEDVKVWIVLLL